METSDILFTAWLEVKHGIQFKSYSKRRGTIYVFYFDMDSKRWEELKVEFFNSTTTQCRYTVKKIKDLLS